MLSVTRVLWALALYVVLIGPLWAQKSPAPPLKFGTVTKADFADAVADSAAPAEFLFDYGQPKIVGSQDEFELVFECTTRRSSISLPAPTPPRYALLVGCWIIRIIRLRNTLPYANSMPRA
ncbi:MAG TPA: hypothetical protein VK364_01985 [Hymenobacter sp.]|nr:hypothetical protein [Hymenobacter sp.]